MGTATAHDVENPALEQFGEAAFFDLDRTVIAKDAMAAFGGPMRRGGLIRRRSLIELGFAQVIYLILGSTEQRLERIRHVALKMTRGWSRSDVDAIVSGALESVVEPIIYDEAMDLIDEHRQAGRRVVIVSASPSELVRPLGRHLGVDDVIASEAAIDADGRYTGELAFFCTGRDKSDAVRLFAEREEIDLSRSYAYSDAFTDVPLLELVGHPVAVNPDRALARVAAERGWETRIFIRPVRLRDRVRDRVRSVPPKPAIALGTGTIVVGILVGAIGWWMHSRRNVREDEPSFGEL
ncbi:MAG: HAD-IB family hydrolase [Acidimicrobiales bacterium]